MFRCLSILLMFFNITIFASTIELPKESYKIDSEKKMIICNTDLSKLSFDDQLITLKIDDKVFKVLDNVKTLKTGNKYTLGYNENFTRYTIYFTELPLLSIDTSSDIIDSPKVFSKISIIETDGNTIKSNAGIEYRGDTSQLYPKKSYEFELWEDETGDITKDLSFLGMREDKDWNIQAMYNEPLKISSKTAWQIWENMSTPYYIDSEPKAKTGINIKYIEVFRNNSYQGIYALAEKIDRKQLKLKKNTDTEIRGELYKGALWENNTTYIGLGTMYDNTSETWGGYEYKYPKDLRDWSSFYNLHDFVINTEDEKFYAQYKSKYDSDNLVSYFIFINALRAADNMGKNIYTARYDKNQNYFFIPWDLDAVLGRFYDSSIDNTTEGILMNGLFGRLWNDSRHDGFRFDLYKKWLELRSSSFTVDKIMQILIDNFDYLKTNGAFDRDQIANPGSTISSEYEEFSYIREWLTKRIEYLDKAFAFEATEPVPAEENGIAKTNYKFQFYPNPARNYIYFISKSNNYEKTNLDIEIFTISGRKVRSISQNPITQSIYIGNIPHGNYIINIKSNSGIKQSFKLIIDK